MVLSPLLEKQLTALVEHPKKFPKFLVFHGEPGTGKTIFARQFAQLNAVHETYIPVNEIKLNQVWEKTLKHHYELNQYRLTMQNEKDRLIEFL